MPISLGMEGGMETDLGARLEGDLGAWLEEDLEASGHIRVVPLARSSPSSPRAWLGLGPKGYSCRGWQGQGGMETG